jgi:hypothetical protein
MSKFVTTSPSTAVPAAFRHVSRSPIDAFPKRKDGLLEDGARVIKDDDVKQSNAGKRLDRLLSETAGLLANGHDLIRALKEGAAQLVALRNRAENRKEFLRQKAGAIFSLKVLSRTGFDRGRMRSLGSGCR